MRVMIIEEEVYLAQSIAGKLIDFGYDCDTFTTVNDALAQTEPYDVVLLSTNLAGQNFYPVIERYKDEIVLLMVSYNSYDTVTDPLKAGARDYIQKPFMIEELQRKIEHYLTFKNLQKRCELYESYLEHQLGGIAIPTSIPEKLPLMVTTNYQKQADAYAFALARQMGEILRYIPLSEPGSIERIRRCDPNDLIYAPEFQMLKKSEREHFFEAIPNRRVIASTTESFESDAIETVTLVSEHKIFDRVEILTIDDYVKFIIHNYQHKFPDTELSKKLGISRKSLWEKRKKYGIFKKK
jgi:DNA-binding NtrC family response regulator